MKIRKAVITAAGRQQRNLPLQTLIDQDGHERTLLAILVGEALAAKSEEICVVIAPGDADAFRRAAGDLAGSVQFIEQTEPAGYGHAVWCARGFTGDEPFLHLVADHLFVANGQMRCAAVLAAAAESEDCAISAVQPTRESLLSHFGAVGGQPVHDRQGLVLVETVLEKPTPTEAEQHLIVPGLRAGHYFCFFGLHVLTPRVMALLDGEIAAGRTRVTLSDALRQLARFERYLALRMDARRYDLGAKYGLFSAQLALALSGRDREDVLSRIVELLALRGIQDEER